MRVRIAALALVGACNPAVPLGDTGTGDEADTVDASTGVASTGIASASTTMGVDPSAPTDASADEASDAEAEAGAYEEDSGTGCAFTCPGAPGGGGGGGFFDCDLWSQDCADGEKCMPWANDGGDAWNAARCSPVDPNPTQLGEACLVEGSGVSGIDDCDIGLMCWNVDAQNTGVCAALCTGAEANPGCPGALQCTMITEALPLCVDGCDPLAQDCGDGQACAPELGGFFCAPAGPAGPGEACAVDACAAGSVCIDGAAALDCSDLACCASYCDPTAPVCPDGATCVALVEAPNFGVCAAG
jgi:hypothetical protein